MSSRLSNEPLLGRKMPHRHYWIATAVWPDLFQVHSDDYTEYEKDHMGSIPGKRKIRSGSKLIVRPYQFETTGIGFT